MDTIFVKNVKPGSPAFHAGLCNGDRILSVNDYSVTGKTYQQVISQIHSGETTLKLEVLPKDQDILQMAYKNTHTLSQDSLFNGRSSNATTNSTTINTRLKSPHVYTLSSMENITPSGAYQEHQMAASIDDRNIDMDDGQSHYTSDQNRNVKSSVSYTTGLSVYHEPSGHNNNSRGDPRSFVDKRKEFEARVKDYSDPPPNKTFSFGLYYPTPKKERTEVTFRRSRDNILQPNDSQENIAKSVRTARVIPLEKKPSREDQSQESIVSTGSSSGYSLSASPSRHSYPDSMRNNPPLPPPRSFSSQTTVSPERQRSEIHTTTRHYVPVVSQAPVSRPSKMSSSLDNLDSRPDNYQNERNLRTNYSTRIYEHPNQTSGTRTFIVKINDNGNESENDENQNQNRNSYGTAFALTRSPHSTSIEIKAKERPRVSQRKKQFETGQIENSGSTPNINRYKTEIQKITSLGKFNSVSARLQNFEKLEDAQSAPKLRRMSSTERYSSPEAPSVNHLSNQNQPQYQEQAPIRIYVSQGTSNNQSSPIVEIVPMSMYQGNDVMEQQPTNRAPVNITPVHVQHDDIDSGHQEQEVDEEEKHGQKPVRKPSFLAAVTASQDDYGSSADDMSSPDSPPSQSWRQHSTPEPSNHTTSISYSSSSLMPPPSSSGLTLTSTPIKDTSSKVILRKKSETSPDDEAIKLQRRTSYLMATAKDRDTNKLSLDKSLTHSHSESEVQMTPKKQPSMTKLKAFFGERTPRILEATERRQDPASPIQEITKMGYLQCKTDIADGKRNSDRSWRPVWVELRGHALFLNKEKKEGSHPFTFDEQPISVKSAFVDIAYDYTKKRNVFRLKTYNGSEYLFQADDHETMLSWIEAVQKNNNPDLDENGLVSANLIIRKSNETTTVSIKSSPQVPHKPKSRLSTKSIIKIPHSPSMKRKKTDDSSKTKTTLKDRIKSFRKTSSASGAIGADDAEGTGMFGVPIKCCIPSPNNDFVPMIVDLCTKIVEARGLEVTGVYRVPGNTAAVNMMMEELNKGIDNMNVDHEKWCDVNVISSLLKAFFRKLPESLVTSELYQAFINANRLEDPERRMLKLKRLLHELPEHHFETFKHLAEHLNKVSAFGHINKMDARNLAIVFGPTLVKKKDDDMASIVKDMSDQCRIIESIILHHEWFFGSWDQDDHVPVDEQSEAPTNPSITRLSCDDDDNTVNPKDIVFSIVQAANKKLRGGKDKNSDDFDSSVSEGFSERNIDQEIYRSRIKGQIDATSKSSPDLLGLASRGSHEQLMSLPARQSDSANDRRMAKSQEIIDSDWDFVATERHSQSMYGSKSLHYSDDSLDKNDELEISHSGLSGSFSVSQNTIDRLRIIEEEARSLREKEEKRKRDFERRKLEKQKIEQNILKTKKEIEIEDRHSVEDLLSAVWLKSDPRNLGHHRVDSQSSDHSNSSTEARYTSTKDHTGGKYFVIQSVSGKNGRDKMQRSSKSSSHIEAKAQRTSSLERLLETSEHEPSKTSGNGRYAQHEDRYTSKEKGEQHKHSRSNLSRSNSLRRGSLDSLIDLIQDGKRRSYEDSDSEDGSDLLSDLTSTFDQKLKVLVNPKYKLNGSSSKLNRSDSSSSSNEKDPSTQWRLPPQVPLAHVNKYGLCSSNDMLEKQFQDPSLHRSPRSHETKVGIACRFERNPSNSTLAQSNSSSNIEDSSNNVNSASTENRYSSVTFSVPTVSVTRSQQTSFSPARDSRTKMEKTEINLSLSNQSSNKYSPVHVQVSRQKSPDKKEDISLARSPSPPAAAYKCKSEKPKKRRHTVGGTDDLEHFKALVNVTQSKGESKKSAWEQLQPVVKSTSLGTNRSLLQWIQNERLRGSTPDLSQQHSPKFF